MGDAVVSSFRIMPAFARRAHALKVSYARLDAADGEVPEDETDFDADVAAGGLNDSFVALLAAACAEKRTPSSEDQKEVVLAHAGHFEPWFATRVQEAFGFKPDRAGPLLEELALGFLRQEGFLERAWGRVWADDGRLFVMPAPVVEDWSRFGRPSRTRSLDVRNLGLDLPAVAFGERKKR